MLDNSPFRCNVLRKSLEDDGRSGKEEVFNPVNDAPLPCALEDQKGTTGVEGQAPTSTGMCIITLKTGTDVKAQDRIEMLEPASEAGKIYQLDYELPNTVVNIRMMGRIRKQ